jgi:hypothetical protein
MAGFTGQGTTVALTTGGAVACVRSITLPTWSMESIDASCLSDTGFMKKIAADLVDAGTVQVTAVFEPTDEPFVVDGASDTITITLPSAGSTGGILTGTGFISECTLPEIQIGGLLEQSFTFTFDGETGPAYTAGT